MRADVLAVLMLAGWCGAAAGDDGRVAGPVLGLAWDRSAGGLRIIHGIPASAVLSEAIPFGEGDSVTAVAVSRDCAVAAGGGGASVWRLREGRLERISIAGVPGGASRVAISPSGSKAAFWLPDRGRALLVSGLPDEPAVAGEAGFSGYAETEAIAVSDGGLAMAAVREGASLRLLAAGPGQAREAGRLTALSGLAFIRGTSDLIAADPARNEIWLFGLSGPETRTERLAGEAEGVAAPVAVQASDDGQRLFVANRGGTLLMIDRRQQKSWSLKAPAEPTELGRLDRDSVFRIHELSAGPLWLLDGREGEPRLRFAVPSRADKAVGAGR